MDINFYKELFSNINQPLLVLDSATGVIVDLNIYSTKQNIKKGMTIFEAFGKHSSDLSQKEINDFLEMFNDKICGFRGEFYKWKTVRMQNFVALLGSQAKEEIDLGEMANESDQKFKSVFDNSMIGYLIMSVGGKILEANKAFCNMLGYSHNELINMKFANIIHEDEKKENIEIHEMMKNGLLPFIQTERRFVHTSGSDLWTILNSHVVYSENNKPISLISTIIDITDKKLSDDHIQSVAHFTDENPFPVMRVSKTGEITYFNKSTYHMAKQWSSDDIDLSFVPDKIKNLVAKSIEKSMSIEKEIIINDKIFTLYIAPVQEKDFADVFARNITEIKKGEEFLRVSEERFKAIFNSSYRFVGLLDTQGKIIEINQTTLDFCGIKHHDVVDKKFWEIDMWGSDSSKKENIKKSIEYASKGNFIKFEIDIKGKLGNEATIIFSIKPVRDSSDNVMLLIPEGSDITDLKKTKKELESYKNTLEELVEVRTRELAKRENFLSTIFKNIPYIITIKDAFSKEFISINKTGLKMFGLKEDTGPIYDEDIYNPTHAKINKEFDSEVISTVSEVEIHEDFIETVYGQKVFHTKKIPVMLESKLKYVMSISEDITYTRKAQQRLRVLSEAIEHNPAAVIITNSKGIIEYVNPKHTELTGYTYSESIGKSPSLLNSGHHEDSHYDKLWETIKAGKIWKGEFLNKNKNGKLYWERASISPIHNNSGEISAFVAVKEDITDMKIASEQLQSAKEEAEAANKAKSAFLANMSHEIRTPMNAVLGFAQILKRDSSLNSEQKQNVDIIFKSGEHLLNLINDVLEMSKIEAGKVSVKINEVNIPKIIDDVETIFRRRIESKDVSFIVEKDLKGAKYIKSDESKIRQILINFLGNSAKFTNKGYIKLIVNVRQDDDYKKKISFQVLDTGVGIKEEEQDKIFISFEQTESGKNTGGGTGLGLAICKQYADMLGAKIEFESEYSKGSSFTFILSTEVEEELVNCCGVTSSNNSICKYSALVYEPDKNKKDFFINVLEKAKVKHYIVDDKSEFIEIIRKNTPDIVVLKLTSNDKESALTLAKMVRSTLGKIPVIAIADEDEDSSKDNIDTNYSRFFSHTIKDTLNKEVFLNTINNILTTIQKNATHNEVEKQETIESEIPQKLKDNIKEAIFQGYTEKVREHINEVLNFNQKMYEKLNKLFINYDYDGILNILEKR